MGEAKRRGDCAKRKAEAIAAGRVKVERHQAVRLWTGPEMMGAFVWIFGGASKARRARTEAKKEQLSA